MIREVLILALIITFGIAKGQNQPDELRPKELTVKQEVQRGYETEIDAPSEFVRRELWRQTKSVARVQQYRDILEMSMPMENGGDLLLYGATTTVQDSKAFLALVTAQTGVDDHLQQLLRQLKSKILVTYYQNRIDQLEKQSSSISRRLEKQESADDSTLFTKLTEINDAIELLRAKQLEAL